MNNEPVAYEAPEVTPEAHKNSFVDEARVMEAAKAVKLNVLVTGIKHRLNTCTSVEAVHAELTHMIDNWLLVQEEAESILVNDFLDPQRHL